MSLHEKISSFYDDELDVSEREQVVSSLKQDSEHKQIWGRYCMIGDAMRRNLPETPKHDLLSRVQIALESEPPLLVPSPSNISENNQDSIKVVELPKKSANEHISKPVAGFAIAASVALASVLGFQMFSQPATDNFAPSIASTTSVQTIPETQELNISPVENAAVVAFSPSDADELGSEVDDVIYAQQSLADDGQWTRITRIGNILLDNNILSRTPQTFESHVNVDLKTGVIPFARASQSEEAKSE